MKAFLFAALLSLVTAASARADAYFGNISQGDGLEVHPAWQSAGLSWVVENESSNGLWTYSYELDVPDHPIQCVITEVSDRFRELNIHEGTTPGGRLGRYGRDPLSHRYDDVAYPALPGAMCGIKWEPLEGSLSFSWTIISDRAPMWGDFYAQDARDGGDYVYAHNTGFGTDPPDPTLADGNNGGWVLVPDVTPQEQVMIDFCRNSFEHIRDLIDPDDESPCRVVFIGNHAAVESDKWTYVLDSSGHQIFRPLASYPFIAPSFEEDLGDGLEDWMAQPLSIQMIDHARDLVISAFGINYPDDPDTRIFPKRDVFISRSLEPDSTRYYAGETSVLFSPPFPLEFTFGSAVAYAPGGQPYRLENRVVTAAMRAVIPVFQYGLSHGLIVGRWEWFDPVLRLGVFIDEDQSRFQINAFSYFGESFLTTSEPPCYPYDDSCNPYRNYTFLDFCTDIPLPWPIWWYRGTRQYMYRCWHWWRVCGGLGGIRGNWDLATGGWQNQGVIIQHHEYLESYGYEGCNFGGIFSHEYCLGTEFELIFQTEAFQGCRLDDEFYNDLEDCHVAVFNTHGGPIDPDPYDGVAEYSLHFLRGYREYPVPDFDDWFMIHQEGDPGLGTGLLRHIFLESCAPMNWFNEEAPLGEGGLFEEWMNSHVADGLRTACGFDGLYVGSSRTGWLFFGHYNLDESVTQSWHWASMEECDTNHPVTVAYGATEEEAAQILLDGRFTQQRGHTGHIMAMESWIPQRDGKVRRPVDLAVSSDDFSLEEEESGPSGTPRLRCRVHNQGSTGVWGVVIGFYAGHPAGGAPLATATLPYIGPSGEATVLLPWSRLATAPPGLPVYAWVDAPGIVSESNEGNNIAAVPTSSASSPGSDTPARFSLKPSVPNPANPSASIRFVLPCAARTGILIFDVKGKRIRGLIDEVLPAGEHSIRWNGMDDRGHEAGSGKYYYEVRARGAAARGRLVLVR